MMPRTPKPTRRHIALLRAINVGGHNVRMDQLRKLFESLGSSNVETFIASGNVIFDSSATDVPALESRIESHLKESLGYEVATFIRSPAELVAVTEYEPFQPAAVNADGNSLYVAFLRSAPTAEATQKLLGFRSDANDFHVNGREAFWLSRMRLSESGFSGAALERTLGMAATARNITTVKKLAAKYGSEA